MATTHILGFPRIGVRRELKVALEAYWRGSIDEAQLRSVGARLRAQHWGLQRDAGLSFVTVGDFSWYDHVLDTACLLGCVPPRFGFESDRLRLAQYFQLARGSANQPAMEMTKWFDTNYHYLVPELRLDSAFHGGVGWLYDEVTEALALGHRVKPVLLGPMTFLHLAKAQAPGFDKLKLLDRVLPAYLGILGRLRTLGIEWVQIDEPVLATDLDARWRRGFQCAYDALYGAGAKLLLTTYFGSVIHHAETIVALPVHGLHIDLARAPEQLDAWLGRLPAGWILSAGVVDGRNVWRADLEKICSRLRNARQRLGERLWIASSCSLLHIPIDLEAEGRLAVEIRSWLAFAKQKLREISLVAKALDGKDPEVEAQIAAATAANESRRSSTQVTNPAVQRRLAQIDESMTRRASPFETRIAKQRAWLQLPLLPTTTIGSFPQTDAVRQARAAFRRGEIDHPAYMQRIQSEIRTAIEKQEALGLDVLVHGEAERNDMVEYFAERLGGFALTDHGWVQSYGSRCVKPPILYGDVHRPAPMTLDVTAYAQSLTKKPIKGMLTGPITILQWSFVRDDQPRETTALQIALAIREEVADLERAGIRIIQIDEPALREGMPLRQREWTDYLDWAIRSFKIASCIAADETQIHTHMCYSEFSDILPAIAALDADVITIETSRSNMDLLEAFGELRLPNEIGPGLYDVHSPRIPLVEEMTALLEKAMRVIPAEHLWVNPDCGLKTRDWSEVQAALANMVEAARRLRSRLGAYA